MRYSVLVVVGATASALPVHDKNLHGVTPETCLSTDPEGVKQYLNRGAVRAAVFV